MQLALVQLKHTDFQLNSRLSAYLWNIMIKVYVCNGNCEEALELNCKMQETRKQPDNQTTITFPFCSRPALLCYKKDKEIYHQKIGSRHKSDAFVGTALVDMYIRCGKL